MQCFEHYCCFKAKNCYLSAYTKLRLAYRQLASSSGVWRGLQCACPLRRTINVIFSHYAYNGNTQITCFTVVIELKWRKRN